MRNQIHPEEIRSAWFEGLTATDLYLLRLIESGIEINNKNVAEFCDSWGMTKAAFYRARKKLLGHGWIQTEKIQFVAPPETLKIRSSSNVE
jgi:hypothetical protein